MRHVRWREAFLIAVPLFALQQVFEAVVLRNGDMGRAELCGWDCGWYAELAQHGYDLSPRLDSEPPGQANWAFFPVFPLLVRLALALGNDPAFSAVLTGKVLFLLAIAAFVVFASHHAPKSPPIALGVAAALGPFALYGNTGYTEPLFLLLTCAVFIALSQGRWWLVASAGALLTGARFVGLAAVVAYAAHWCSALYTRERMPIWPAVLMPSGLLAFAGYLWWRVGDPFAFVHVQSAWGRALQNPLELAWWGLTDHPVRVFWAAMGVLGLAIGGWFLVRREWAFGAFTLFATLVPLSTGLWAMPRFVVWQAPVLLFVARGLRGRVAVAAYVVFGLLGQWAMYSMWLRQGTAVI